GGLGHGVLAGRKWIGPVRKRASLAASPSIALPVQPALGLVEACPPAGPGILARRRLAGAVGAADRGIALIVQLVVGDVVLVDVGPVLLLRPVGQRVELPEPEALVPRELRRLGARL